MSGVDEDEEVKEYRMQLEEVEKALQSDPKNEELLASKQTLLEIIALSETLEAEEGDGVPAAAPETASEPATKRARTEGGYTAGMECEALHPSEKKWFNAVVKVVLDDGSIIVDFGGLEPPVQLKSDSLRPVGAAGAPAARITATYEDANPETKRARVASRPSSTTPHSSSPGGGKIPTEIPQYLKIKPSDSEKVKQSKQKRIKAIKSKMRFAKKDEESAARRAEWQNFAKKSGVARHHSIFSTTANPSARSTTSAVNDREQVSAASIRKSAGPASGELH